MLQIGKGWPSWLATEPQLHEFSLLTDQGNKNASMLCWHFTDWALDLINA